MRMFISMAVAFLLVVALVGMLLVIGLPLEDKGPWGTIALAIHAVVLFALPFVVWFAVPSTAWPLRRKCGAVWGATLGALLTLLVIAVQWVPLFGMSSLAVTIVTATWLSALLIADLVVGLVSISH